MRIISVASSRIWSRCPVDAGEIRASLFEYSFFSNEALMRTISAADLGGCYAETDGLRYVCRLTRGAAQ